MLLSNVHLQKHTSHLLQIPDGYNSTAVGLGCDSVWDQNELFCSNMKHCNLLAVLC